MALGVEAADVIAAVGDAVEHYTPGDEVMTHPVPLRDQGTWAPRLIAPVAGLARKSAAVSWQAAGAFPVPGLTAAQVIDDALAVRADDVVLVNGAGGVTGGLLVSVAAARGAEVIATAGPANRARVRGLGAAHLLDYHDPHWPDEARAMTAGLGVTAAANAAPPPRSTRSETAVAKPRLPRIHPSNGEGSPSRRSLCDPMALSSQTWQTCSPLAHRNHRGSDLLLAGGRTGAGRGESRAQRPRRCTSALTARSNAERAPCDSSGAVHACGGSTATEQLTCRHWCRSDPASDSAGNQRRARSSAT
jgi:hypothetical protein